MNRFQKTAIILGVVYLVVWLIDFISNLAAGAWTSENFTTEIIINTLDIISATSVALLFVFNALHHKSTAAKTAAIIGGVWWLLDVCATITFCVGRYLHYINDFPYTEISFIFTLSGLIWLIAAIILMITVGFFADSHRKNKAVLTSSIVYIVVFLFRLLFSHFGWSLLASAVDSELSHIISPTLVALCALAFCSIFACAATIKNKNYE